jgi:hypothetical protein
MNYQVIFESNWGNEKLNKINFPSNPHTGNMFLVLHNHDYNLFDLGEMASQGIQETAEFGKLDKLIAHSKYHDDSIYNIYTAKVLKTPGSRIFSVNASKKYPFLSFSTMIAPSSDWFTGISSLPLFNGNAWLGNVTIPLYAMDAGTARGTEFVTEPKDHEPYPQPISVILPGENDLFPNPRQDLEPIAFLHIIMT